MPYQPSQEVEQLLREKMATGRFRSEDELLVEALHALDAEDEELRAIEEGLASVDRGESGVSLDEAFSRLRKHHGISD